jgi:uncharacterized membrane protein
MWGIDLLCLALCVAWVARAAYPPDIRRGFMGAVIVFSLIFYRSRRKLLFVQIFRKMVAALAERPRLRTGVALTFGAMLVLKGTLKALALEYPMFDVGIYHQLLWNLSQGNGYLASISQADHFLRDHLILSLATLAPLYKLASLNRWTLGAIPGFLTGAMLALIFFAWWFLAERFPGARPRRKAFVSAILVLAAWGFQTFFGNLHWGFHENLFGGVMLSWGLSVYFVYANKDKSDVFAFISAIVLLILAAGSKETYLLVTAFTSLGLIFCERKISRKTVFGFLTVFFLAVFVWYAQSDRDPGKNYFIRYYGYLGSNLREMISNLVFHPLKSIASMPLQQDGHYLFELIIPFGLFPLLALPRFFRRDRWGGLRRLDARWVIALGILPGLGSGLISTAEMLRNPNLHYFFEIIPVLGVVTLMSLFAFAPKPARVIGICFVLISWLSLWEEPWRDIIPLLHEARADVEVIHKIDMIPADASIMTMSGVGTWLSSRKTASVWDNQVALQGKCPDYFVFEADPNKPEELVARTAEMKTELERCRAPDTTPVPVDFARRWWIYASKK